MRGEEAQKLAVLVSGNGSNLERIFQAIDSGEIPNAKVSLVISDRPCFGLERAEKRGVPTLLIPRGKSFSEKLSESLPENIDLIVLAGFLSILSESFCEEYSGKIINIHPSLLPKFGGAGMWGAKVHESVLLAEEKQSGATVHFVTAGLDQGAIILQKSFEVSEKETPESLAEKVHEIEYEIFPKAIAMVLEK